MNDIVHLELVIPLTLQGMRLDQALAQLLPDYSRARLQAWLHEQAITVNGVYPSQRMKVQGDEHVVIHAALVPAVSWSAQDLTMEIVFEDESLLVINKSAGMVVHPAAGNRDGTLLNALLHHCPALVHLPRAGIVHRLDKDTSGLLVVAKNLVTHHALVQQLQARSITREYVALVNGVMASGGTVDAPIARHPRLRTQMAVATHGKPAVTHYRVMQRFARHTLVKVMLETGRTHQIRVHMAHINYPIVGDPVYTRHGVPKGTPPLARDALLGFKRQALHAKRLALLHPERQEQMAWEVANPDDLERLLHCLAVDETAE